MSGQSRPYVRPVCDSLPLAIMGVRMRVQAPIYRACSKAQAIHGIAWTVVLTTTFPITLFRLPAGSVGLAPAAYRIAPERQATASTAAGTRPFAR